jgi:hypothetical protein
MASRKTHHHAPQIPVDPGAPRGERMVVMMVAVHDVKQDNLKIDGPEVRSYPPEKEQRSMLTRMNYYDLSA